MSKEYYHTYLRSEEWRKRRQVALSACGNRCQVCNGSDRLEVHHRTYARVRAELPEDLIVLCRECHGTFHERLADNGYRENRNCVPPVSERRAPLDIEDAALMHLLEVVLNEPGLLATVDDVLDVGRIVDDRDRRIAKAVIELFDELGEFHLADVLARCHEPGDAERIEELARRGEHYHGGNFEGTFQLALERIRLATKQPRHFSPRRMSQRRVADEVTELTI